MVLRLLLFSIVFLLGVLLPALSEASGSDSAGRQDVAAEIKLLLEQTQAQMEDSRRQIEQGVFQAAHDGKSATIQSLSILLELFMPLPERIRRLWEDQNRIITSTRQISQNRPENPAAGKTETDHLVRDQASNLDRTDTTIGIVRQQIQQTTGQTAAQPDRPPVTGPGDEKPSAIERLTQVAELLEQSLAPQRDASRQIKTNQLASALKSERKAADKLKEALDALSQQQNDQNQEENQQEENQQQDNQQQDQQEKSGDASSGAQQNQNEANRSQSNSESSPRQGQQSGESARKIENQLSPSQALQEIGRLQKEAEAEKRRRERATGIQAVPGRIPIEKDW